MSSSSGWLSAPAARPPWPVSVVTARSAPGSRSWTERRSRASPASTSTWAPVRSMSPASVSAMRAAFSSQAFSTAAWKCRSDQSAVVVRCTGHVRPVTCPAAATPPPSLSSRSAPV
jgi:hypothetical protein